MHKLIICCLFIAAVCAAPAHPVKSEKKTTELLTLENKDKGWALVKGLFKLFGASGDDLGSLSISAVEIILAKILKHFTVVLSDQETRLVVGIFTGLVKTTVVVLRGSEKPGPAFSKFLSDNVGGLVDYIISRIFGQNSKAYKYIKTYLPFVKTNSDAIA
ncbi:hypothetical protein SprV_0401645300 [Sparganum proliferum]